MAEPSPLQPIRDSCRALRQEWERVMRNAESATTQLLSSFKARRESLEAERAEVRSLEEEVAILRRSVFQHRHEEEKKVLTEMVAAERISKNVCIQLAEAKRLQCQLTGQLEDLRLRITEIRQQKSGDDESKSVSWDMATSRSSYVTQHLAEDCFLPKREASCATKQNILGVAYTSFDVLPDQHALEASVKKEVDSSFGSTNHNDVRLTTPLQCVDYSNGKMRFQVMKSQGDDQPNDHQQNSDLRQVRVSSGVAIPNYVISGYQGTQKLESENTKVSSHAIVKAEPCEEKILFFDKQRNGEENNNLSFTSKIKHEAFKDEIDELDHVVLSKRLELLKKRRFCNEQVEHDENIKGSAFCHVDSLKKMSQGDIGKGNSVPRKKFKGYQVPIEIALQEDAPGLLEKLQDKGLLEDMELYGGFYEDVNCMQYDPFKDLECVASKLWGPFTGLFKPPHIIRQHLTALNKGPTYCLSCLVSLVEQTRSLKQRGWPVEWGWCRQLQAFLFVFDKHNRIVLERPEYGNATYFFELVELLPLKWQVERLIRVLSVVSLVKTALLENRPLEEFGHELTIDEAKILEDYGWNQNTGLGSFLNFCDRVVHDVKEDDNAEWRKRIGNCLMDGHDRGRITVQNIPERLQKITQYHGKRVNDGGDDEDIKPFSQT